MRANQSRSIGIELLSLLLPILSMMRILHPQNCHLPLETNGKILFVQVVMYKLSLHNCDGHYAWQGIAQLDHAYSCAPPTQPWRRRSSWIVLPPRHSRSYHGHDKLHLCSLHNRILPKIHRHKNTTPPLSAFPFLFPLGQHDKKLQ